jgi:hypothetical protein
MSDQALQRSAFAYEAPAAPPCNEIYMHINFDQSRRRPQRAARLHSRNRTNSAIGENREKTLVQTVPRWHQDRERERSKKLNQSSSAGRQLDCHLPRRPIRAKLALFVVAGMVQMAPTVLKNPRSGHRKPCQAAGEPRLSEAGDHSEGYRDAPRERHQAIERRTRLHRVVVTPPQCCYASG